MADHLITIWKGEIINSQLIFGLHNFLSHALNENRKIILTLEESAMIEPHAVEKQDNQHNKDRRYLEPS